MESIWSKTTEEIRFDELKHDIITDVLIIGGGITGILCAYMLEKAGVDYVLTEAGRICSRTTKNTTAKITYQHGLIYDKMIERYGIETAKMYLESQKDALEEYRKMSKEYPCDFEECDSFVYSRNDRSKIEKETEALCKIGCVAEFTEKLPLSFSTAGSVKVTNQAQFNPLKFLFAIAKNLNIYENTKVLEFLPDYVLTNRGKIRAKKIIVATHFPLLNKHGGYFLKMYQHRSYVLALKNADDVKGMYVDESKKGMSFRSYNGLTLIGGGSHRTGKTGGGFNELLEFAKIHYPDAGEVCRWATQDCMTLDDIPYIGRYSKSTPDLYVATGFNKWGMTSAMTAAKILSDMVLEKENEYESVYSPSRTIIHPQLAINAFESVCGILNPKVPRCPHLGCALKYNRHEHSWDCSCHGSRFDENGKVLDNPANGDIKI